jgi:hypothetical protein
MIVLIGKLARSPIRLRIGTMYMWRYPIWLDAELIMVYLRFWYKASKADRIQCDAAMIVDSLDSGGIVPFVRQWSIWAVDPV